MCNSNLSVMTTNDDLGHQHEEDAMGIYKFRGILKGTDTPIYYKPKKTLRSWGPFFIYYWNGGWKITVRIVARLIKNLYINNTNKIIQF